MEEFSLVYWMVVTILGVSFFWETTRYLFETFLPSVFVFTRPIHPLLIYGLAWLIRDDWLEAAAVAAGVGFVHLWMDKLGMATAQPVSFRPSRRGRRSGLPELP
jgi:hypothetical protein